MEQNIIDDILKSNYQKWKNNDYIYEKKSGVFQPYQYGEFYDEVIKMASYLHSLKLQHKKIAIYSKNSYQSMVAEIAVIAYLGTVVSIVEQWREAEIKTLIDELELSAIIYEKSKADIIKKVQAKWPNLNYICLDDIKLDKQDRVVTALKLSENYCSKIVFSSGTTAVAKAIMLSQKNIFANLQSLLNRAPMNQTDSCYLFLPISHTYGGICNFIYSLSTGMKIYLSSDKNLVIEELMALKPTVFCAVPIFYEKIYAKSKAENIAICQLLGGNIKYLFSGGAPLRAEIRKSIKAEGLNLLEAYGLSETSSLISLEYTNYDDFESVGTVLENIQLKIAELNHKGIGEILVKGDNVCLGYYNNPQLNSSVFDSDGYFHTGDIGYLKAGKLYLVGRKKRVIIGDNARNIYPEELEKIVLKNIDLKAIKIFEQDKKIVCLAVSNKFTDENKLLIKINRLLPKHCQISKCIIRPFVDSLKGE